MPSRNKKKHKKKGKEKKKGSTASEASVVEQLVDSLSLGCSDLKEVDRQCRKLAAVKIDDEDLFKQPPLPPTDEDCPICFLRMPILSTGKMFKSCCGKVLCCGCTYAVMELSGYPLCPFCRIPMPTSEREANNTKKKLVKAGHSEALYDHGCDYRGGHGVETDHTKALELWHRASLLGHAKSHHNIGYAYDFGHGVERDNKIASQFYKLAAMRGDVDARYNLGVHDCANHNNGSGLKHFMMAVERGDNDSLNMIQRLYSHGHATKDDYVNALRSYQTYLGEIRSSQRDEAAADERYRYY